MTEVSSANYSEYIMNFINHMSNELACKTQRGGQGETPANWQRSFMHN